MNTRTLLLALTVGMAASAFIALGNRPAALARTGLARPGIVSSAHGTAISQRGSWPASRALWTLRSDGQSLRDVDWNAVLASDPNLQLNADCPPPPVPLGPCVTVPLALPATVNGLGGSNPVTSFTGYALTAPGDVLYADLDGDGLEEAVIRTDSTGTGGSFGFLVYHQASPGPRLVAVLPGYKLGVEVADGALLVTQPFYFGFEPNCCPTAVTQTTYALGADGLYTTASPSLQLLDQGGERAASAAEITVAAFYRAIDSRAYRAAYDLISPDVQARKSFEDFAAGYATTTSVAASIAAGATPNEALVGVTSVDTLATGERVVKRFSGSWSLVDDPMAPLGKYLSRASIQEITDAP